MKVKYAPSSTELPNRWLKENTEYVVLEIFFDKTGAVYRILTENSVMPTLHSADLFEIVSNKIPSSWVAAMGRERGFYLEIAPIRWTTQGFWEDYSNQDSTAEKIFEEEKRKIFAEES
jgi:hypothetical protein